MKNFWIALIMILIAAVPAAAQQEFSIFVMNAENNSYINDAYVIAMKDSTTHYANSGTEGIAVFTALSPGRWLFRASRQGFSPDTVTAMVGGDRNAAVMRLKPTTELEEVVVQGDKSKIVNHLPNGERFFLSPRALKLPDSYQALAEVPMLKTDVIKGQLELTDGTTPLIMINGEERESSVINMIKPSEIEAVEVITIPDVSYAMAGVKAIVNLKVKQREGKYLFINARTDNQVPFHNGNTGAGMEVGSKKFSFYTRPDISADYHRRARNEIWRENTDYSQTFTRLRKHSNWQWSWLNRVNWEITDRDKVAVSVLLHEYRYDAHEVNNGESTKNGTTTLYNSISENSNYSRSYDASAYYIHTFSSGGKLEAKATMTHNRYTTADEREEQLFGQQGTSAVDMLSAGNYLYGEVKYSDNRAWGNFVAGSNGISAWDNITDRLGVNPKFLYRSQFASAYFTWSKMLGSWYLSGGAAAQWLHMKDNFASLGAIRPWATASASWTASAKSTWRLSYYHSNGYPSLQNSNPYTTGTDPLYSKYGNPELKMLEMDDFSLQYMLNSGNWYITSWLSARYTRGAVRPYGYTEGDRYILTSINSDIVTITPGVEIDRRFPWGSAFARVSVPVAKWEGLHRLTTSSMMLGANGSFGKFYVSADFMWTMREESVFEKQTSMLPYINAQAVYNATPNFSIGLSLSDLAGNFKRSTKYDDGSFRYTDTRTLLKTFLAPSVMLQWRLMRNPKQKMQFDPDFQSGRSSYSL